MPYFAQGVDVVGVLLGSLEMVGGACTNSGWGLIVSTVVEMGLEPGEERTGFAI